MFLFLHRLSKLGIGLACCGAAFLVWQQRDLAWPLWDWFDVWRDVGWREPTPLPSFDGRVRGIL